MLAETGLRVAGIEAGGRFGADEAAFDELANDYRNRLGAAKANHEVPTWRPDPTGEATTSYDGRIVSLMGNGVGGGTVHYAGQHFRLAPWHFRLRSATEERYGASALPSNCTATDWPVSYDDLEPFYARVDETLGVSGEAGRNPFEGDRSTAYPLPPLRRTGWTDLIADAARRISLHPFAGPAAIRSEPHRGLAACTYCGFCNWNGCHVGAKGSTHVTAIPRAEATGNLAVATGARVISLDIDAAGRMSGVTYICDGRVHFQPARAVFLSAHTLENTRLLLLSRSTAFPTGLANRAGQVGRNAMSHVSRRLERRQLRPRRSRLRRRRLHQRNS